jgi:ABC-type amino acid transport substrate-binding protein
VLLALTGLAALAVATAAPAPVDDPLRVGVYENPPKIFVDAEGRATGFFPDLVRELAPALGRPLVFEPCRWSRCLELLESGRLDLMPDVARVLPTADD